MSQQYKWSEDFQSTYDALKALYELGMIEKGYAQHLLSLSAWNSSARMEKEANAEIEQWKEAKKTDR
jgi:hypothetical protein